MSLTDQMHETADQSELVGDALIKEGERLIDLGRKLLVQAGQLRSGEGVKPEKGLLKSTEPTTIGYKGAITEREVINAAMELGDFTRKEFADSLGLKVTQAGYWITKLLKSKPPKIERNTSGNSSFYSYILPREIEEAPKERPNHSYADRPRPAGELRHNPVGVTQRLEHKGRKGGIMSTPGRARTIIKRRDREYEKMQQAKFDRAKADKAKARTEAEKPKAKKTKKAGRKTK